MSPVLLSDVPRTARFLPLLRRLLLLLVFTPSLGSMATPIVFASQMPSGLARSRSHTSSDSSDEDESAALAQALAQAIPKGLPSGLHLPPGELAGLQTMLGTALASAVHQSSTCRPSHARDSLPTKAPLTCHTLHCPVRLIHIVSPPTCGSLVEIPARLPVHRLPAVQRAESAKGPLHGTYHSASLQAGAASRSARNSLVQLPTTRLRSFAT